jgi:hypothetical protein
MPHRTEQLTLFELTGCDDFEPLQGLAARHASSSVIPKSEPLTPEVNVSSGEAGVFRAVSPWATLPLHEVCASCGREIRGSGFVILDYEELGAFCDRDCGNNGFRSYLYEAPEKATSWGELALAQTSNLSLVDAVLEDLARSSNPTAGGNGMSGWVTPRGNSRVCAL